MRRRSAWITASPAANSTSASTGDTQRHARERSRASSAGASAGGGGGGVGSGTRGGSGGVGAGRSNVRRPAGVGKRRGPRRGGRGRRNLVPAHRSGAPRVPTAGVGKSAKRMAANGFAHPRARGTGCARGDGVPRESTQVPGRRFHTAAAALLRPAAYHRGKETP